MYKVMIEEVIGEIKRVVTLETEDVELVKTLLEIGQVKSVDSDVPNRNIDKEWQELLDWLKKNNPPSIQPYKRPWTTPFDPNNPFTVTC